MEKYVDVVVFLVVGALVPVIGLIMAALIRPSNPTSLKRATYECGEVPFGEGMVRFNIRYYVFALVFVVFDVETVFLYPWAVQLRKLGMFALVEMFIFLLILIFGLVYAWRKRVLEWS